MFTISFSKNFFMVILICAVLASIANIVIIIMKIRESMTRKLLGSIDFLFGMLSLVIWNSCARNYISTRVFYAGFTALAVIMLSGIIHLMLYIFSADSGKL